MADKQPGGFDKLPRDRMVEIGNEAKKHEWGAWEVRQIKAINGEVFILYGRPQTDADNAIREGADQ